ncbi:PLDc N-terminal domain-containing protein [uncultured Lutibacter sp.]|uniref:PLDc N-terminal domain-containing protein n=1 Tax=uncultured Lutibacter sp. TaxID=437739 RepID=UPI00260BC3A8|nr:PLDc N-terminal domain-containing protein [uncultured Lutibacter sp.]
MKSSTKFWLTIFTFLPIVFLILFFSLFFTIFIENIVELEQNQGEFPVSFFQSLAWFIPLLILMALTSLGIKIYYIVHTNNKPDNDTNKKIMWTLLLIFTGSIGAIVYYFVEITPLEKIEI